MWDLARGGSGPKEGLRLSPDRPGFGLELGDPKVRLSWGKEWGWKEPIAWGEAGTKDCQSRIAWR